MNWQLWTVSGIAEDPISRSFSGWLTTKCVECDYLPSASCDLLSKRGANMRWLIQLIAVIALVVSGCGSPADEQSSDSGVTYEITPTAVRAERRLFDGAPPVPPHPPMKADCKTCHTETGKEVPRSALEHLSPLGPNKYAPANPHHRTRGMGETANCRQCHVFKLSDELFVENRFDGLKQDMRRGDRLFDGSPPVMPHPVHMRENCLSCHSGPAARPEIRCSHPERINCSQCHVARRTVAENLWAGVPLEN